MFGIRQGQTPGARKERKKRAPQLGGFTGLEGDFEAERRRAAEAAEEPTTPYEDDSTDKPRFPESSSGLTHP